MPAGAARAVAALTALALGIACAVAVAGTPVAVSPFVAGAHADGADPAGREAGAATNRLIAALAAHSFELSGEVKDDLARIRASGSLAPLVAGLAHRDPRTREKCAWALGQVGDAGAVAPLLGALAREPSGEVRRTVAWALGRLGAGGAAGALIASLDDPDGEARQGAAWALGSLHAGAALPSLVRALGDPVEDVRHAAAWALGKIGDRTAVAPLRALARREASADVRAMALAAIRSIEQGVPRASEGSPTGAAGRDTGGAPR
jgi:HEAT repeat protein